MESNKHIGKISVMGIVNLTSDSFYAGSRVLSPDGSFDSGSFLCKVDSMLSEGADILDLGSCSTRPGSDSVGEEEEWSRLKPALTILRSERPGIRLSIDTFRPGIVSRAFDLIGPFIVNDVSGGPDGMLREAGGLGLEYVAMHTRGTPRDMQSLTDYDDVTRAVCSFFSAFSERADAFGIKDWILDPGFGFAKTVDQNWQLLREMSVFKEFGRPVLAGLSRKSFLFKPLGITPDEALPATMAANMLALCSGADILRVHDVRAAVETVGTFIESIKSLSSYKQP